MESKQRGEGPGMQLDVVVGPTTALVRLDYTASLSRQYLPAATPIRCWLCGEGSPIARFRNDAHVVSQALGNRSWFTPEECDHCNHAFGAFESDLVASTGRYRLTSMHRGKRPVTFRDPSRRSSIRSIDGTRNMQLVEVSDEPPIVEELSDKELRLSVPIQSYRPLSICRVLTRLAFLLRPQLRSSYSHLFEWLRGNALISPQVLLRGDTRGASTLRPHVFVFEYRGKRPVDADVAALFIYEGMFYWYPLPKADVTVQRAFMESGFAEQLPELTWKAHLLTEASVVRAHSVDVFVKHGGPVAEDP